MTDRIAVESLHLLAHQLGYFYSVNAPRSPTSQINFVIYFLTQSNNVGALTGGCLQITWLLSELEKSQSSFSPF